MEAKVFGALVNGLIKRTYYAEKDLEDEVLKEQLAPEMDDAGFRAQLDLAMSVVQQLAYDDMDLQQAEEYLKKHPQLGGSEGHQAAILKLWRTNRSKVHDAIVKSSLWGNHLRNFSWRLDVKTRSKHISELNDTAAIVEMDISSSAGAGQVQVVRFEMDRENVAEVIRQINAIEARLGVTA